MKFTILNEKKTDLTLRDNEVYNSLRMYFDIADKEERKAILLDF